MNANNTAIVVKRENPYKDKANRSGKKADNKIRAWRSWDESTWLRRDQERHK